MTLLLLYIVVHNNIISVVREWNNLPEEAKQIGSLISFKFYLNRNKKKVPKYYGIGKRKLQILHTRLRSATKCSSLNNDLFLKNMTESYQFFVLVVPLKMLIIISLHAVVTIFKDMKCLIVSLKFQI